MRSKQSLSNWRMIEWIVFVALIISCLTCVVVEMDLPSGTHFNPGQVKDDKRNLMNSKSNFEWAKR